MAFSGCDRLKELGVVGGKPAAVDPRRAESAEPVGSMMTAGERFTFYRWLVKEMQEQILVKPVTDPAQVNNWANVLSQRGSLEGVYHGLVLSTDYQALETGRTDVKAVRFVAQELAGLEHPLLPDTSPEVEAAREKYAKELIDQPLFTLKRLLGERILEESSKRKGDREQLATWYAGLAARWSAMGIPLGNEQRMRTDQKFHYQWAQENNLGLIQWELLNREHRILNALGGVALPIPAGK